MQIGKSEGADFKYGNRVFFNSCPKISKSSIFSPKFMNFCWIPWFQIWQYCFQIPAKIYPNKAFLGPKFKHFCWRCWFQMWQYCLQVPGHKHPNEVFLVKNTQYSIFDVRFRHLWFSGIFFNYRNLKKGISTMTILYSNFSTKIPKLGIFGVKFRHFRFSVKFWN